MNKKSLKTGIMGYEKIVAARVFGKYTIFDKELKKRNLTKKELDDLFFDRVNNE